MKTNADKKLSFFIEVYVSVSSINLAWTFSCSIDSYSTKYSKHQSMMFIDEFFEVKWEVRSFIVR